MAHSYHSQITSMPYQGKEMKNAKASVENVVKRVTDKKEKKYVKLTSPDDDGIKKGLKMFCVYLRNCCQFSFLLLIACR